MTFKVVFVAVPALRPVGSMEINILPFCEVDGFVKVPVQRPPNREGVVIAFEPPQPKQTNNASDEKINGL